ncbi:mucin-15 [Pteronotus mesoamericanus]|uniref:mucin-15 n=1 Tax=Pteronotus mesoamericanus TaxID=1884717 RepID=UPI0023ED6D0E|nr:mucin-15 [Pteronotus parnellii mesoamericanus]
MLTSTQTPLISTLFSLLLFVSHGKESLEVNTTENISESLKNIAKEYIPWKREADFNLGEENRETFNDKASNSSLMDPADKSQGTTDSVGNLTTDFSWSPRTTPPFSESPPLIHSVVSKLPQNSSVTDENPLSLSEPPNTTSALPTPKFPWTLANDTVETDNSSIAVSVLPSAPSTTAVNPTTTESGQRLNTTSDSMAGLTPYQEMTLQPTLKFTNNSKIFPNTSDPQEENRNTGVVFGAILGAILGASLLTLVGYLLCGKRKTNSFSHRRLYDDRNEPVLRLDNAPEPYDVSFGNASYYNQTVNDSSVPAGQENARDGIPMDDIPPIRTSV